MRRIVALVVATVLVSACASMKGPNDPTRCAWMFGAAGAVGGALGAYDYADNHNDGKSAWIGIGGMVTGALLGYGLCTLLQEEPPPPPQAAEPPPPPPPSPPPPPEPAPPDPCAGRIVLRGVTFPFDSDVVTEASKPTLDVAADTLRECPNVRTAVEGFTDSVGSDTYNQGLSERRAESVSNYLRSHGVSPDRLSVKGYGESRPVADNSTEEGRALNRRVELHALE
jgi:OOP family OmpA-OmpF porin